MNGWDIYWITRLDYIQSLLGFTGVMCMCGCVVLCVVIGATTDSFPSDLFKFRWYRAILATGILCVASASMMPSSKEAAAIIVLPAVANSEAAQEIGSGLRDLASEWIKAQIEETKK